MHDDAHPYPLSFISHGELDSEFQFGSGEVDLVRLEIPLHLAGRKAADVNVPGEVHVISVVREGSARLATPGTIFREGDILYIAVAKESQSKLERLLGLR